MIPGRRVGSVPAYAAGRLAVVCLAILPLSAAAQEFRVTGNVGQRFSVASNPTLDADNGDDPITFSTNSTFGLNASYRTPRANWRVGTGFGLRFTTRETDDELTDQVDRFLEPRLNASGNIRFKRFNLSPSFGFRRRQIDDEIRTLDETFLFTGDPALEPVPTVPDPLDPDPLDPDPGADPLDPDLEDDQADDAITDDLLVDEVEVTETTLSPGLGFSRRLTRRLALSFGTSATLRRFSEQTEDFANSTSLRGSVGLSRRLSQRTSLGGSVSVSRFDTSAPDESDATTVSGSTSLSSALSPRLNVSGSVGLTYSIREGSEVETADSDDDTAFGVTGSLNLNYATAQRRFRFGLSQAVSPSSDGELRDRLTFSLGVSESLTERHNLSLSLRLSRSASTFGGADDDSEQTLLATSSLGLGYRVSENWRARVSYNFLLGNDDDGIRFSNGAAVSFSRGLDLYP